MCAFVCVYVHYTFAIYFSCFMYIIDFNKFSIIEKEKNDLLNVPNLIYLGGSCNPKERKIVFLKLPLHKIAKQNSTRPRSISNQNNKPPRSPLQKKLCNIKPITPITIINRNQIIKQNEILNTDPDNLSYKMYICIYV